jgi:N-acetylmuramoyl-L-alanine amidase
MTAVERTAAGQSAPAQAQRPAAGTRFVVAIDAAHGGDDGGGLVGASVPEKTVTLGLSVRLRSLLTARGFQVATTREGNVNVASDARAQTANHAEAGGGGACLILHASQAGSGVHIFVSALAATEPSRFLAWKTAQSAFVSRSLRLAGTVNSAFEHSSVTGGASTDDPQAGSSPGSSPGSSAAPIPATLGRASLAGMDSLACPAVAIEVAPIRGADGKVVAEVTDPQYQAQVVEALAAAMLEWKVDSEADAPGGKRLP